MAIRLDIKEIYAKFAISGNACYKGLIILRKRLEI